jgi:hypothetical protein
LSHYALLDENNIVIQVVVASRADDGKEAEFRQRSGENYRQTSYNTQGGVHLLGGTPFRKNYAGIGYYFDEERDAFIPSKPYPSWTLNEDTCLWEPPVPYPADGKQYTWDEEIINWVEVI